MILRRHPLWRQNLNELIRVNALRPFAWGEWDCALWAATAVHAMTGVDFAEPYRGKYSDSSECAKLLRDEGPGSLFQLCSQALGPPVHPAQARCGDVVYKADNMPTLGICYGRQSLFVGSAFGVEGLIGEMTLDVRYAFRVPV